MLSNDALTKFKELYKKEFKVDISEEEASKEASKLLGLFKEVYGDPSKLKDDSQK